MADGDFKREYASKGVAGTGLGLGIAGTALWLLNNNGLGLFGGNGCNGYNGYNGRCGNDTPVNRYELNQAELISQKDMEIATLRAVQASKDYTQAAVVDLSDRLMARFEALNARMCAESQAQAVWNGTMTATVGCQTSQLQSLQREFDRLTEVVIPCRHVMTANICPTK